nr:acyltransferase [Rhodoblastus sphagnicola]
MAWWRVKSGRDSAPRGKEGATQPLLANLESLRGICAVMVAIFHTSWLTSLHPTPFIQNAYLFVDFFFVLSGFIIALNYVDRGGGPFDARGFLIKRFFRLYPLHLATMLALLALILAKQFVLPAFTPLTPHGPLPDDYATSIVFHLTMLHALNLHHGGVLNVPSWSIAAEFWTYCVFCICCVVARGPAIRIALVAGIGFASFLALLPLAGDGGLWTAPRMLRCLAGFGLGALVWAAVAWRPIRLGSRVTDVAFVAVLTLLYCVLAAANNHTPTNVLALPLFAAVIWLAALDQGSWTRHILEMAPFTALGRLSYSIYMVHLMLATAIGVLLERGAFPRVAIGDIHALMVLPGRWGDAALVIYLGALIALSAATYRWIEKPWREMGRRLASARTPVQSAAEFTADSK